jgi:predicted RNA-binding Zn-ribbon protein involved in translation (DUF1610 family)
MSMRRRPWGTRWWDLRISRARDKRVVQCKRWTTNRIRAAEIRELGGALLGERRDGQRGMLVTSSEFTRPAETEAAELGITLVGGRELVRRLEAARASELLRQDTGNTLYPCPACGIQMILDCSPRGYWLRCPRYRDGCKGSRDLGPDPERALGVLMRLH